MTVVITGANRGIGLELCRQTHARGETVVAACRHASPELAAVASTSLAPNFPAVTERLQVFAGLLIKLPHQARIRWGEV